MNVKETRQRLAVAMQRAEELDALVVREQRAFSEAEQAAYDEAMALVMELSAALEELGAAQREREERQQVMAVARAHMTGGAGLLDAVRLELAGQGGSLLRGERGFLYDVEKRAAGSTTTLAGAVPSIVNSITGFSSNSSVLRAMGAQSVRVAKGSPLKLARLTGNAVGWTAEAGLPGVSSAAVSSLDLPVKTIQGTVEVTRAALASSEGIAAAIEQDLAAQAAYQLDKGILWPEASGPAGIFAASSGAVDQTATFTYTAAGLAGMVAAIEAAGFALERASWVLNPLAAQKLRATGILSASTGSDTLLAWERGTIMGRPVYVTPAANNAAQATFGTVGLIVGNEVVIGEWNDGYTDIVTDPYSKGPMSVVIHFWQGRNGGLRSVNSAVWATKVTT